MTEEEQAIPPTKCCICHGPIDLQRDSDGKVFWEWGHNAWPVRSGRCCSSCNSTVVIAERLVLLGLDIANGKHDNPDHEGA
jgi:hypothetical protein